MGGDGRAIDAARQRLGALPAPAGGGLCCGHEVDQFGVDAQLGGVAPAGREQPGRRLGVLAQQGVARQRMQQGDGRGLGRGEAGRVGTEQRPEVGERAVGVTGEGHAERGAGVLVHEQVETDRSRHTGAGGQVRRELAQDGEEADRVEIRAEQAAQVRQVVRAERTAHVVAGAGGAAAEHVDDVGAGIVAAPDPGGADGRRPPHLVAQRRQQVGEAGTGGGVVAGGRPTGERRDGQHAVGLTTAAQRRQRTGRAQVATGVVADPAPRGIVERRELRQVVAPGGRPQRGLQRLGDDLVALAGAGDAPERRLDPRRAQPERGTEVAGAARRAQFRCAGGGGLGPLDRKGLLAAAVAAGVAGALGAAVVGGRARREERQAVGVMVGVEQGGQSVGAVGRLVGGDAYHHEDVDGGRVDGAGQHHPQGHPGFLGAVEVDHPAHALVDGGRVRVVDGGGEGVVGVGPHGEVGHDVAPGHRGHDRPAVVGGRGPARRQPCRTRRAHDGRRLAQVGEPWRLRQLGVGGHRGGRLIGGVGRCEHPGDPRRSTGLEAVGQHAPRVTQALDVVAGAPAQLPVAASPGQLVGTEPRVVGVDVDLVGVHADP